MLNVGNSGYYVINYNYFISLSILTNNFVVLMCFNSLKFSQGTGL